MANSNFNQAFSYRPPASATPFDSYHFDLWQECAWTDSPSELFVSAPDSLEEDSYFAETTIPYREQPIFPPTPPTSHPRNQPRSPGYTEALQEKKRVSRWLQAFFTSQSP
jgi:hypothetical protein